MRRCASPQCDHEAACISSLLAAGDHSRLKSFDLRYAFVVVVFESTSESMADVFYSVTLSMLFLSLASFLCFVSRLWLNFPSRCRYFLRG